ncbi:MAG: DUF2190 family protein [Oligosphaeraceae bacterium]
MMAVFVQRGESVDFTPSRDVGAGEVIVFGGLPGVVKTPVRAGGLGALALTGVYDVRKEAVAVAAGDRLFWEEGRGLATPMRGGVFLGLAAANSPASSPRARVLLNFGQSGTGAASGMDYEWQTI